MQGEFFLRQGRIGKKKLKFVIFVDGGKSLKAAYLFKLVKGELM
jgi:hypothetical protein